MKTIVIIRHGKAQKSFFEEKDFYRKLIKRGRNEATYTTNKLLELEVKPDLIISSPAIRAIETAEIFASNFNYPLNNISRQRFLYDELYSSEQIIFLLNEFFKDKNTVFIIGHNPTLLNLIFKLTDVYYQNMKTSGAVVLDFHASNWLDIHKNPGNIRFLIYPRT
jgi:phosphohistidine phosphatase